MLINEFSAPCPVSSDDAEEVIRQIGTEGLAQLERSWLTERGTLANLIPNQTRYLGACMTTIRFFGREVTLSYVDEEEVQGRFNADLKTSVIGYLQAPVQAIPATRGDKYIDEGELVRDRTGVTFSGGVGACTC